MVGLQAQASLSLRDTAIPHEDSPLQQGHTQLYTCLMQN